MATKVKAVVIGNKDYKEKDKLITLYTLEKGKMFCSMRGVRGEKAKLKTAKEIFCFGEYFIEEKGNVITTVDVIDPLFSISADLDKYYEACAVIDVVGKVADGESNPPLFIALLKCLKAICYDNLPKFYCIDKFLIDIFGGCGYFFLSDKCSSCGALLGPKKYFNLDSGELLCPNCKNASCINVSGACYGALKALYSTDYGNLSSLHIGGGGEREAFNLLRANFEWRIGQPLVEIL